MKDKTLTRLFRLLFLVLVSTNSFATPPVGSREYKLLLEPSLFNGSTPELAVSDFWTDLDQLIQASINRTTSGSFSLSKTRTVKFYDTASSCLLYNNKLVFREREENSVREVTLKYRSFDRYVSGYQDMSGTEADAVTKFEEDIATGYSIKYSHSTTQGISASKNLNKLDDPIRLYPGLLDYNFDDTQEISLVGGLSVLELVYKGTSVDLGSELGKFSLTLWYNSINLSAPAVAEISFKYKDASGYYSENVVTRAKKLFESMQTMNTWLATNSMTKTAFVYNYNPSFCQ